MDLPTYFRDFLDDIRLTDSQVDDCKTGHTTLRNRLLAWEPFKPIIVSTFIQGSYRRATAVRPRNGKRADVDVVVVTKLSQREYPDPARVFGLFTSFLDKYYKGKYEIQGRSIGIELSYVDLDLVITSAPAEEQLGILVSKSVTTDLNLEEADNWKLAKLWVPPDEFSDLSQRALIAASKEAEWSLSPLYIPDRDVKCWRRTHPLEQLRWTRNKNKSCNGHYVNVVKALKWWRVENDKMPKYPKGYPLEHLIGASCPDNIGSVAQGIVLTLEAIVSKYKPDLLWPNHKPVLPDHGVPEHDVFKRVTEAAFAQFYDQAVEAAKIARQAYDATTISASADKWRILLGDKFPVATPNADDDHSRSKSGFTHRDQITQIGQGRFA